MSNKIDPYWERNQLVLYLTKLLPSWLERHREDDDTWEDDWRNIVFISFPEGLFSWHIHDSDMLYFKHLKMRDGDSWDGSTTLEKYEALESKGILEGKEKYPVKVSMHFENEEVAEEFIGYWLDGGGEQDGGFHTVNFCLNKRILEIEKDEYMEKDE